MSNLYFTHSEAQKFLKSIQQLHKKRQINFQKTTQHHVLQSHDDIFVDLTNIWQTRTKTQQKQYEAIRTSQLFSKQRKVTFIRFNYRSIQNKNFTYQAVYNKLIKKDNKEGLTSNKIYGKGTMHISQLWSQRKLKEVIGNLPFPRDRLKVLKMYPKKNNKLYLGTKIRRLATQ